MTHDDPKDEKSSEATPGAKSTENTQGSAASTGSVENARAGAGAGASVGDGPTDDAPHSAQRHPDEPHHGSGLGGRLNWLRAGVLGANDGIVSTAGLVVGVAGAAASSSELLTAGLAGLLAGSMSMAAGEYVSVSTQRDSERAMLDLERLELARTPEAELEELTGLYMAKGLTPELAREVAVQLTAHDALAAHAETELGIDPEELTNPWHAAWASFLAFTVGALLPLLAIVLPPESVRIPITVVAVIAALVVCGWISARMGGARVWPAVARNVTGGALAMAITYVAGTLLNAST